LVHEQISPELANLLFAKPHRNWYLPLYLETGLSKRNRHTVCINQFQETMADFIVDILINTQNVVSELRI